MSAGSPYVDRLDPVSAWHACLVASGLTAAQASDRIYGGYVALDVHIAAPLETGPWERERERVVVIEEAA